MLFRQGYSSQFVTVSLDTMEDSLYVGVNIEKELFSNIKNSVVQISKIKGGKFLAGGTLQSGAVGIGKM